MQEDSTEGGEMKRQERMKMMKDMAKQIRLKGRTDAANRWWIVGGRLRESVVPSRMGRHHAEMGRVVEGDEKGRERRMKEIRQHKSAANE